MKILLLGNYPYLKSQSMDRFAGVMVGIGGLQTRLPRLAGLLGEHLAPLEAHFGGEPLQVYLPVRNHDAQTEAALAAVTMDKTIELLVNFAFLVAAALFIFQQGVLNGTSGLSVCQRLRQRSETRSLPIIMLTARVEESDTIRGLELGADDYVTKPFSVKELVARVRAVIRRSERPEQDADALTAGDLQVDLAGRRVHVGDTEVALTRKEFDLLVDLMRNRGRVVTRQRLLERVWGYDHPGETRTVDVHVRQLRKKLGATAGDRVETVVGVGYRFRGSS